MSPAIQKLHLGCFDIVAPGWVNPDATPHIYLSMPIVANFNKAVT
jgi:hypothetical protein